MTEDALKEKEDVVAGEGLSPQASRISMAGAALSGRSLAGSAGSPMSHRSMAGAANRVSLSSVSPIASQRHLDAVSSGSEDEVSGRCHASLCKRAHTRLFTQLSINICACSCTRPSYNITRRLVDHEQTGMHERLP